MPDKKELSYHINFFLTAINQLEFLIKKTTDPVSADRFALPGNCLEYVNLDVDTIFSEIDLNTPQRHKQHKGGKQQQHKGGKQQHKGGAHCTDGECASKRNNKIPASWFQTEIDVNLKARENKIQAYLKSNATTQYEGDEGLKAFNCETFSLENIKKIFLPVGEFSARGYIFRQSLFGSIANGTRWESFNDYIDTWENFSGYLRLTFSHFPKLINDHLKSFWQPLANSVCMVASLLENQAAGNIKKGAIPLCGVQYPLHSSFRDGVIVRNEQYENISDIPLYCFLDPMSYAPFALVFVFYAIAFYQCLEPTTSATRLLHTVLAGESAHEWLLIMVIGKLMDFFNLLSSLIGISRGSFCQMLVKGECQLKQAMNINYCCSELIEQAFLRLLEQRTNWTTYTDMNAISRALIRFIAQFVSKQTTWSSHKADKCISLYCDRTARWMFNETFELPGSFKGGNRGGNDDDDATALFQQAAQIISVERPIYKNILELKLNNKGSSQLAVCKFKDIPNDYYPLLLISAGQAGVLKNFLLPPDLPDHKKKDTTDNASDDDSSCSCSENERNSAQCHTPNLNEVTRNLVAQNFFIDSLDDDNGIISPNTDVYLVCNINEPMQPNTETIDAAAITAPSRVYAKSVANPDSLTHKATQKNATLYVTKLKATDDKKNLTTHQEDSPPRYSQLFPSLEGLGGSDSAKKKKTKTCRNVFLGSRRKQQ